MSPIANPIPDLVARLLAAGQLDVVGPDDVRYRLCRVDVPPFVTVHYEVPDTLVESILRKVPGSDIFYIGTVKTGWVNGNSWAPHAPSPYLYEWSSHPRLPVDRWRAWVATGVLSAIYAGFPLWAFRCGTAIATEQPDFYTPCEGGTVTIPTQEGTT